MYDPEHESLDARLAQLEDRMIEIAAGLSSLAITVTGAINLDTAKTREQLAINQAILAQLQQHRDTHALLLEAIKGVAK